MGQANSATVTETSEGGRGRGRGRGSRNRPYREHGNPNPGSKRGGRGSGRNKRRGQPKPGTVGGDQQGSQRQDGRPGRKANYRVSSYMPPEPAASASVGTGAGAEAKVEVGARTSSNPSLNLELQRTASNASGAAAAAAGGAIAVGGTGAVSASVNANTADAGFAKVQVPDYQTVVKSSRSDRPRSASPPSHRGGVHVGADVSDFMRNPEDGVTADLSLSDGISVDTGIKGNVGGGYTPSGGSDSGHGNSISVQSGSPGPTLALKGPDVDVGYRDHRQSAAVTVPGVTVQAKNTAPLKAEIGAPALKAEVGAPVSASVKGGGSASGNAVAGVGGGGGRDRTKDRRSADRGSDREEQEEEEEEEQEEQQEDDEEEGSETEGRGTPDHSEPVGEDGDYISGPVTVVKVQSAPRSTHHAGSLHIPPPPSTDPPRMYTRPYTPSPPPPPSPGYSADRASDSPSQRSSTRYSANIDRDFDFLKHESGVSLDGSMGHYDVPDPHTLAVDGQAGNTEITVNNSLDADIRRTPQDEKNLNESNVSPGGKGSKASQVRDAISKGFWSAFTFFKNEEKDKKRERSHSDPDHPRNSGVVSPPGSRKSPPPTHAKPNMKVLKSNNNVAVTYNASRPRSDMPSDYNVNYGLGVDSQPLKGGSLGRNPRHDVDVGMPHSHSAYVPQSDTSTSASSSLSRKTGSYVSADDRQGAIDPDEYGSRRSGSQTSSSSDHTLTNASPLTPREPGFSKPKLSLKALGLSVTTLLLKRRTFFLGQNTLTLDVRQQHDPSPYHRETRPYVPLSKLWEDPTFSESVALRDIHTSAPIYWRRPQVHMIGKSLPFAFH